LHCRGILAPPDLSRDRVSEWERVRDLYEEGREREREREREGG